MLRCKGRAEDAAAVATTARMVVGSADTKAGERLRMTARDNKIVMFVAMFSI